MVAVTLFLIPILHQTTTSGPPSAVAVLLFLIPILHQTTTSGFSFQSISGCFSFQFYIKPQLRRMTSVRCYVVSHSNSTSNHNTSGRRPSGLPLFLIPILHQTTTLKGAGSVCRELFLIPILHQTTTAHHHGCRTVLLFLIPILHQTTTSRMAVIHILHVTHMTPMHKTSCRTPGKLVGCNFVFQRAVYQKNSSC